MSAVAEMQRSNVGPLPERWLHCPPLSTGFILDRFLAFKTPLSEDYDEQIADEECYFRPQNVLEYCSQQKQKLGLWIDLTFSMRFYNRRSVEEHGVAYYKLQCRGNQETPTHEQTKTFLDVVERYIEQHPLDKVAVHCTHGFNRTGFLIVSYLVEKLDYGVDAALQAFAQHRAPGIYKQDYIEELYRRYDEVTYAPAGPSLPSWCFYEPTSDEASDARRGKRGAKSMAEDDEDNGDDGDDDDDKPQKRRKRARPSVAFMKDIDGVEPITCVELSSEVRAEVARACGWKKTDFPGGQPVSMDRRNLQLLCEKPYLVSWKADGTRYMLYIRNANEKYFIDRNFNCFQAHNVTFLRLDFTQQEGTLVDGEMVIDHDGGRAWPRYLIYDIIQLNGHSVAEYKFNDRLNFIFKEIVGPRRKAFERNVIDRNAEPFGVRQKDFWPIAIAEKLLGEFAKKLSHPPDGLIFQPADEPYTFGVSPSVLKWKPHELNSIDFRLRIAEEKGPGILPKKVGCLYVGQYDRPFATLPKCTKDVIALNNKIVECNMNRLGQWEILRERTDKLHPNSYNTAVSVFDSIQHPVTKENLLEYIRIYGYRQRERPKEPGPAQQQHQHQHQQPQAQHRTSKANGEQREPATAAAHRQPATEQASAYRERERHSTQNGGGQQHREAERPGVYREQQPAVHRQHGEHRAHAQAPVTASAGLYREQEVYRQREEHRAPEPSVNMERHRADYRQPVVYAEDVQPGAYTDPEHSGTSYSEQSEDSS